MENRRTGPNCANNVQQEQQQLQKKKASIVYPCISRLLQGLLASNDESRP